MEQSREQSLKYVQGGLYFPELPQTHHGQHWNDMELDRTDGQVKLSILLTACNSEMCTEMEGLMMVRCLWHTHRKLGSLLETVFLISEDSRGVLAQSQLLSEICDSLKPAQYRVLHSCLGANIPAKWGMTKLGPLLFLDSFHQAAPARVSIRNKHPVWKLIRLAGWVFSLLSSWYPCWCFLIPSPVPQECYCCELRFCMCFQEYPLETEGSSVTLHVLVETGVLLARRLRSAAVWGRGDSSWSNTNCIWSLSVN